MGPEADDLAHGPGPVTGEGRGIEEPSLAAFFAQPADEDEEPETSLAAFYAQPSDDEDTPLHVLADRDQAEHHAAMIRDALANCETFEMADELGRRLDGKVVGLVVQFPGETHERLLYGINP